MLQNITAIRGDFITFSDNPFLKPEKNCIVYVSDALIIMKNGKITNCGSFHSTKEFLPAGLEPVVYHDAIITSGFVDTHVHYPQIQMIGAYGEKLLEWLNKYTFKSEQQFAEFSHASFVVKMFVKELLRSGTTTAAVYCTVYPESVDAFFDESLKFNMRMVSGKVMMDRNAPKKLLDTAQKSYDECKTLIQKWHEKGRLHYCVTPRFAPTSTQAQLDIAGTLLKEHKDIYLQTHLCENIDEMKWVTQLFPKNKNYLDIYAKAGLVGKRSIFGHGIYMNEEDFQFCYHTGAAISHCPTSNLFLGSGFFRLFDALDVRRPVLVGLGTDVGAGTSLCHLQTLNEAYKVSKLNGTSLSAIQAFYLATTGGAKSLYLDDKIGRIVPGFEADLCVLDLKATPFLEFRQNFCTDINEKLFVLMTLGDDRVVKATYVAGFPVYERDSPNPFIYPNA